MEPPLNVCHSQMLALACLDVILAEDRSGAWLSFITERGYLQHLVESLSTDDEQLQAMLLPQPEPLKSLYIFESKIVSCFEELLCGIGVHEDFVLGLPD